MISGMYKATSSTILPLYLYGLVIVINTGILVYLLFIKKCTAKKLIITSIIEFIVFFLIVNTSSLISFSFYDINIEDTILLFFKTYVSIFILIFIIKVIKDKITAKKLNKELNK